MKTFWRAVKEKMETDPHFIPVMGIEAEGGKGSVEWITNHGEDYEYSIRQYIKNGILIRFDDITIKSKFFREEGGLQTIRTKEYIYKSIKKIQDTFPEYCKMYIRKSSGNAELRLRDNSGNKKQEAVF